MTIKVILYFATYLCIFYFYVIYYSCQYDCTVTIYYSGYCYHYAQSNSEIMKKISRIEQKVDEVLKVKDQIDQIYKMLTAAARDNESGRINYDEFEVCQPILIQFYIYDSFVIGLLFYIPSQ